MKVLVIFEFDHIQADSSEADVIVSEISKSCEHMRIGFNADGCYIQEVFDEDDFILQQTGKL